MFSGKTLISTNSAAELTAVVSIKVNKARFRRSVFVAAIALQDLNIKMLNVSKNDNSECFN